jgi:hypothetical protein
LAQDDKPALANPPAGFNAKNDNVSYGGSRCRCPDLAAFSPDQQRFSRKPNRQKGHLDNDFYQCVK